LQKRTWLSSKLSGQGSLKGSSKNRQEGSEMWRCIHRRLVPHLWRNEHEKSRFFFFLRKIHPSYFFKKKLLFDQYLTQIFKQKNAQLGSKH